MAVALSNLSSTWATSANTVNTAIRMNVTDTASAANSKLLELAVNDVDKFLVYKSGDVLSNNISANNLSTTGSIAIGKGVDTGYKLDVIGHANAFSFTANSWFHSYGQTGWYNDTYGGGIYMADTTWVRSSNNKGLWAGAFSANTGAGDVSQIQVQNNGGTGENNVAAISFHCAGYWGTKFHLRADGYIGIGGWSASTWRWYLYTSTGDMTAAGNVTAYSDIRLKENITPLYDSLTKVKLLNGVRFTWKNLPDIVGAPGKADYGILAHEVEAVAPELISESVHTSPDGDKYKTVAYDKLVPMLIEAIKTLSDKVDHLEDEIWELKNR